MVLQPPSGVSSEKTSMKLEPAARAKLQSILDDPNESPRAKKAIRLALKAIGAPSNAGRPGIDSEVRERIISALKLKEKHQSIADREQVGVATVRRISRDEGLSKKRVKQEK